MVHFYVDLFTPLPPCQFLHCLLGKSLEEKFVRGLVSRRVTYPKITFENCCCECLAREGARMKVLPLLLDFLVGGGGEILT